MNLQSLEIFDYLFFLGGRGELQGKILHLRPYTRQPPGLTHQPAARETRPRLARGYQSPAPFFLSFLNRSSENQAVGQGSEAGEGRGEGCL